jgi:hypothetical protein
MKTDYRLFVVDEISFDVVSSVVFIVIVVAVLSIFLVKTTAIGTTIAVLIKILTKIPKIIHFFFLPIVASLKHELILYYLLNSHTLL